MGLLPNKYNKNKEEVFLMDTGTLFTADMFEPIVTAVTGVAPIAIGAGVSIFAVTWVAKKGFSLVKSMMSKG